MSDPAPRRHAGLVTRPRPARSPSNRFVDQINRNLVALISLVLALTSLGYNTWRNETTEVQRNYRQASFRILVEVGEFEQVILLRRYFIDESTPDGKGGDEAEQDGIPMHDNWVTGWGKARMIRDISSVLPAPLPEHGQALFRTWEDRAGDLDDITDPDARQQASDALLESLNTMRESTVQLIAELS